MAGNIYSKDPRGRKARSALAKSNTISFSIEGVYENDRQKFNSLAQDLGITFDGNNNVLDNTIKEDTSDNTSDISDINSKLSSGYTGSFSVITSVDFTAKTTTSKTVTVTDGLITGVA